MYQNLRSFRICKILAVLFLLFFISENASAQRVRRFSAEAIFGLTASQIDGDNLYGYHKLGLQTGIQVNTALGKRSEMNLGFQFTQRGAQRKLIQNPDDPVFSLTLNYVEVPLLFSYKDKWKSDGEGDGGFYQFSFNGGVSYARLIGSKLKSDFGDIILQDEFNENDGSLILGATFFAQKHLGFSFRYNRSFTFIWDPRATNPDFKQNWLGHNLSFLAHYSF